MLMRDIDRVAGTYYKQAKMGYLNPLAGELAVCNKGSAAK